MAVKITLKILKNIAKGMNEDLDLEPPIDLDGVKLNDLREDIVETGEDLIVDDAQFFDDATVDVLMEMGVTIPWMFDATEDEDEDEDEAEMTAEVIEDEPEEEVIEEPKKERPQAKNKKAKKEKKSKAKKSKTIPISKYALMIPEMDQDQFNDLKEDIQQNGQQVAILMFNGEIIDGRSRYLACLETNTAPIFEDWDGKEDDLLTFVMSMNLKRRHLSAAQRAALGAEILPELEEIGMKKQKSAGRGKKSKEKFRATEEAAKITGSTSNAVSTAKKVKKESPETFEKMKKGKTTIASAKKKTKTKKKVVSIKTFEGKLDNRCESFLEVAEELTAFVKENELKIGYKKELASAVKKVQALLDSLPE